MEGRQKLFKPTVERIRVLGVIGDLKNESINVSVLQMGHSDSGIR